MPDPRDPFDDPDAPPSEEEKALAEELRTALSDPTVPHPDAELARALSAAWDPRELPQSEIHARVERALATREVPRAAAKRSGRLIRLTFGAGAILALAASVALVLWREGGSGGGPGPSAALAPALAVSRSTQALFDTQFARIGGETGRIDRIAMARASDLRDNQFAKWGVR